MIDVSADGFDLAKVDLTKITAADIAPKLVKHETEEETAARAELHLAAARNKMRVEMAAERINAAVKARCDAIHALTPKGAEQLSYAAMRDGTSVEQFKAIVADFQATESGGAKGDEDEAESTAQAILAARRAAKGEATAPPSNEKRAADEATAQAMLDSFRAANP